MEKTDTQFFVAALDVIAVDVTFQTASYRFQMPVVSSRRGKEFVPVVETKIDFERVFDEPWREIGIDLGDAILTLGRALHENPLLARLCHEFPQCSKFLKVRNNEK